MRRCETASAAASDRRRGIKVRPARPALPALMKLRRLMFPCVVFIWFVLFAIVRVSVPSLCLCVSVVVCRRVHHRGTENTEEPTHLSPSKRNQSAHRAGQVDSIGSLPPNPNP